MLKLATLVLALSLCFFGLPYCRGDSIKEKVADTVKDALDSKVDFVLFTRENPKDGEEFEENVDVFDADKPIKFIVHGWLESSKRDWYGNMTEALLKNCDCSVVQVNWSPLARMEYSVSAKNTKIVGDKIGALIERLRQEKGIPLENVHVIGHSLGGHVAGFAGKEVARLAGSKIAKITGLDAAGPLFETISERPKEERLSTDDAEIVENIHTDGGAFGYKEAFVTHDYFANDGTRIQPGCGPVETVKAFSFEKIAQTPNCSHAKSIQYYIRALNGEEFRMTKCGSWDDFKAGRCSGNKVINLGDDVGREDKGSYYFETNDKE